MNVSREKGRGEPAKTIPCRRPGGLEPGFERVTVAGRDEGAGLCTGLRRVLTSKDDLIAQTLAPRPAGRKRDLG